MYQPLDEEGDPITLSELAKRWRMYFVEQLKKYLPEFSPRSIERYGLSYLEAKWIEQDYIPNCMRSAGTAKLHTVEAEKYESVGNWITHHADGRVSGTSKELKKFQAVEPAEINRFERDVFLAGDSGAAPIFNENSETYPELLAIALSAWKAVSSDTNIGIGNTPKQRILDWVDDNYPELSDSQKSIISRVANWKTKPGRPADAEM